MTRKKNGTFGNGNTFGKGRPARATESTYLTFFMEKCPPETFGKIVDKAVSDALDGDGKARDWLAKYLVGVPYQSAPTLLKAHLDELSEYDPVLLEHGKQIESESMDFMNERAYEGARKEILVTVSKV
jgi:hypothetical protein